MPFTMQYELVNGILVVVHGKEPPARSEWDAWLRRMDNRNYANVLVFTDGGGPNRDQRLRGEQFWRDKPYPKFAFVTSSPFVRGMLIAFAFVGMSRIRAFHPVQIADAVRFLDVPDSGVQKVVETVRILRQRVEACEAA